MAKKKGIVYAILTTTATSLIFFLVSHKTHAFDPFNHLRDINGYDYTHTYGEENPFTYKPPPLPSHPTVSRFSQCVKLFHNRAYCACLNNNLPAGVSFGDYKNMLIIDRRKLINHNAYGADTGRVISQSFRARRSCIQN